ncbi:uncharacterized protein L203_105633 [Cryptococcus depauperatus CBS 7841]|uniref:Uncharacterized protein n=1 Tax=Cryptococcus depauperatus CBS 7841 TaxID=1295531 RepID=A0A1E3IFD7_9TREE|nr:hypothetical protein L203_03510 [Cryptococcus depauperatus CBS 7841]
MFSNSETSSLIKYELETLFSSSDQRSNMVIQVPTPTMSTVTTPRIVANDDCDVVDGSYPYLPYTATPKSIYGFHSITSSANCSGQTYSSPRDSCIQLETIGNKRSFTCLQMDTPSVNISSGNSFQQAFAGSSRQDELPWVSQLCSTEPLPLSSQRQSIIPDDIDRAVSFDEAKTAPMCTIKLQEDDDSLGEMGEKGSEPIKQGLLTRRTRSAQACEYCRKRKARCIGRNPCERCIKSGKICVFTPLSFRSSIPLLSSQEPLPLITSHSISETNFELLHGRKRSTSMSAASLSLPLPEDADIQMDSCPSFTGIELGLDLHPLPDSESTALPFSALTTCPLNHADDYSVENCNAENPITTCSSERLSGLDLWFDLEEVACDGNSLDESVLP